MQQLSLKDRLIKASVQLNDDYPFFAYMVMHLNDGGEIDFDDKIPTMAIDATGHLRVNPKWCDQFDYRYLMGILAHEVSHLAFQHLARLGRRHHEIFNMSTDIEVNAMLIKNGFSLPQDGIIPQNDEVDLFKDGKIVIKKISEKHSEEIYDELYRKLDKNNMITWVKGYGTGKGEGKFPGKGNGKMPKSWDQHTYGDKLSDKDKKKNAEKWKDKVIEGNQISKSKGKEPAGMGRILDKLNNPQLGWRALLWKYIRAAIPWDSTWSYPSKKSFSTGIYMPSVLKENIDVVISVDTSGSIGQEELSQFLGEVVSIGSSFRNVEITIIIVDAAIHEVYTLKNENIPTILNLKISGGGGTDHNPVGVWIEENKPDAKCIINFTDGYTSFYPEKQLTGDSVWVLAGHSIAASEVPFGKAIKLEK